MSWRFLMLSIGLGAMLLWAARPVCAQPQSPKPQVGLATSAAVTNLLKEISAERLGPELRVADFLNRTGGTEALILALQRANRVGEPRWIDEQTCQVQLEISGPHVAAALQQIAASNPRVSPVKQEEFDRLAQRWQKRDFTATGSSTSAAPATDLRPSRTNRAWAHVRDEDRLAALASARKDAADRILSSLRPIRLGKHASIDDLLQKPEVLQSLQEWLDQRPITRADFRRDLQVELDLAVTPTEVLDELRERIGAAAEKLRGLDLPASTDQAAWKSIRRDFDIHMANPTGRGAVASDITAANIARPALIPGAAPTWVNVQAEETASAPQGDSKLKAAMQAEIIARKKLRDRLEALPLSKNQTVGQAAQQDARLRDAISLAVAGATITKTEYDTPKGSVTVRLLLDLRDFWNDLHDAQ